jgi:hypothetical protein
MAISFPSIQLPTLFQASGYWEFGTLDPKRLLPLLFNTRSAKIPKFHTNSCLYSRLRDFCSTMLNSLSSGSLKCRNDLTAQKNRDQWSTLNLDTNGMESSKPYLLYNSSRSYSPHNFVTSPWRIPTVQFIPQWLLRDESTSSLPSFTYAR